MKTSAEKNRVQVDSAHFLFFNVKFLTKKEKSAESTSTVQKLAIGNKKRIEAIVGAIENCAKSIEKNT